jgi:hypothetical protein
MVRHGSMREEAFASSIVALSTFDLLRQKEGGGYGLRFSTAEDLRLAFRLRPDAQVLLVSVAKDKRLEAYWTNRNEEGVPAALRLLGAQGITAPNFSSFVDAPSSHTRWNLQRIHKSAVELSDAGVAVVPHLNARTTENWLFWEELLREQPAIRIVCKEFQTGLHRYEAGVRALWRINELQYRLKRKLHPILVGGARFVHVAARHFDRFTVIDSVPFLRTVKRRRCIELDGGRLKWEAQPLPARASLEELLEHNHSVYARVLHRRVHEATRLVAADLQLELPLLGTLH